jgi:hypothetical protein
MHQDMIFRIIRKSFENISTSFVNRDLIEGLVYFIHESDPQKVLELISSVYQQPDFKEKYGKRFGSLIDFIETTGYSASSQNNLDIIRTAYTQKEIDVVTLNAIIFANPKNLEAILTEDLPIKYFADTLKYDGRLSVSPEEIKERFVSKILEAAKKREISAKEFFSLWGRLMRYTETSGHHSVTEMALELSSLPDNPFALTVDLFMSSFAFSSEEKKTRTYRYSFSKHWRFRAKISFTRTSRFFNKYSNLDI